MCVLLDFTLKNSRPRRLIESGCFEDVRGIDPVVGPSPHDMFLELRTELKLEHGYLCVQGESSVRLRRN